MKIVFRVLIWIFIVGTPVLVGWGIMSFGDGAVALCFGVVITALATTFASVSLARRRWPTTTGVVTHSEVQPYRGNFGWRDRDMDSVLVKYSFTVENQTFDGCFTFGRWDDRAWRFIGNYPPSTVKVYYNPRHPANSVLVPGLGEGTVFCLLLGMAAIGGGCCLLWH